MENTASRRGASRQTGAVRHGSDGRRLIGAEQIEDEFIEDIGADNGGKKVYEGMDYRHIERALSRSTTSLPTE